jgi:uncharacterized pyridoxamine 5'-phosphate oxidase family protein
MIMSNKRGTTSGTEVIVSFVLFTAFVVFIFAYLNPLKPAPTSSLLTNLEIEFQKNTSISIDTKPFAVNKTLLDKISPSPSCFALRDHIFSKVFITDKYGKEVSYTEGTGNVKYTGEKMYYANNASREVNATTENLAGCIILDKDKNYSWSVVISSKIYYNKSITELKNAYDKNYTAVKNNFKIPSNSDFSILILDSNRNEIIKMEQPIPRVNALSKEIPIEILSDDNGLKTTKNYLRMTVW